MSENKSLLEITLISLALFNSFRPFLLLKFTKDRWIILKEKKCQAYVAVCYKNYKLIIYIIDIIEMK